MRLKPGEQKDHALDEVDEKVPEENALQTCWSADQPQTVPTDIQAGRHGGENTGAAQELRRPIGDEGCQDRQHDLDPRVTDPTAQPQHQPTDGDTPQKLTDD